MFESAEMGGDANGLPIEVPALEGEIEYCE